MKYPSLFILLCSLAVNQNTFSQWSITGGPNAQVIYSLHITGTNLFAATYSGVFLTTDNGENWILKNNGMGTSGRKIYALAEINNNLIAGTDSGVFVSTNYGEQWIFKNTGFPIIETGFIHEIIAYNSTKLFAGTEAGVYESTDYGDNWTERNSGLTDLHIYSFTFKQNKLFAGSESKVFVSTNEGLNWSSVSSGIPSGFSCDAMGTDGSNLYLGLCCGGGLYVSTNDGALWQNIAGMPSINTFMFFDNKMLSGSADGVLYSVDGGFTWTAFNTGLQYLNTTAFAVSQSTLFAGVENFVWRRPTGQLTGLKTNETEIPSEFALYQNYPNPFNPETNISYELPITNYVRLSVYDILGREIAILVNEKQHTGKYEVKFTAQNLPSGVYFYRLETSDFTQTRKMILMK